MNRLFTTFSVVSLVSAGSALAAEPFTILDAAPPNAALVLSVPDWAKMRGNFDASPYGKIWNEPEIQSFVHKMWEDEEVSKEWKKFAGWLDEAGIDKNDLKQPSGNAGLAMWVDHTPGSDKPGIGMIFVADFGENAESMQKTIQQALDKAEDKHQIDVSEDTYGRSKIISITHNDVAHEDDDKSDDESLANAYNGMDEGTGHEPPFKDAMDNAFTKMHLVWVDHTLVISNNLQREEDVIDFAEGKKIEGVGASSLYQQSRTQHAADLDAFGIFILSDDLRGLMEDKASNIGPLVATPTQAAKVLSALGLGAFKSASLGMRLVGDANAGESSVGVLMPEKTGIVSLFSGAQTPFTPPAFVPVDAAQIVSFNIEFPRIFDVARGVVNTMPDELRQRGLGGIQGFEGQFGTALKALGPEVHVVSNIHKPFTENSKSFVVLTKTSDALAFVNAFGGFAPMLGMEARDFQGSPIYEDKKNNLSIGIGFGYVFVGSTVEVENMMRRAGHPDEAGLSGEERFTSAIAPIKQEAIVHEWVDSALTIDYAIWSMKNADKLILASVEADARENGYDLTDEDRKMMTEHLPKWFKYLPSAEAFTKHLGDTVFMFRSTPEGFQGKSVSLPPR